MNNSEKSKRKIYVKWSLDWKSAEHPRCTFPSSPCKISDSLKGFFFNDIHKRSLSSKIPLETSIPSKESQGTLFNPIPQLIPNAVFFFKSAKPRTAGGMESLELDSKCSLWMEVMNQYS